MIIFFKTYDFLSTFIIFCVTQMTSLLLPWYYYFGRLPLLSCLKSPVVVFYIMFFFYQTNGPIYNRQCD